VLDVSGNGSNNIFNAAFDSTGTSAFININRYNGTGIDLKWGNTEDRFTARLVDVSHDLQFISATSAVPALTILNANRYIGIGTSSPDSNLEVEAVAVDAHVNQIKITQASWSASQNKHKSIVWDDKTNPLAGIGVSFDGSDAYMDWHSFYNGGYTGDANILMRLKGNGQLGIGTTTPSPSAKLEISSTTQGFLPPRMTTAERDAITAAAGLVIYNNTTATHDVYNGSWSPLVTNPIAAFQTIAATGAPTIGAGESTIPINATATGAATDVQIDPANVNVVYSIVATDVTNTLRIVPTSGLINGAASFTFTTLYESVSVMSDGTNLFIF
jgi:hypothetical protein